MTTLAFTRTNRGFARAEFTDYNGEPCSVQKSSLADDDAIWLGVNDPHPKIFPGDNTGWHDYPLPENVQCSTRMHLTRDQVAALLPHLQRFVETGEVAPEAETPAPADEPVGPGLHTLRHAIALLTWWADDESDDPEVVEKIQQSQECVAELRQFETAPASLPDDDADPAEAVAALRAEFDTWLRTRTIPDAARALLLRRPVEPSDRPPDFRTLLARARPFVQDAIALSSEVRSPNLEMKACLQDIDAALGGGPT